MSEFSQPSGTGPETPPVVRITRRFDFSASHRYWVDDWSAAENEERFGLNVRQHGHNYVLEVTLTGPVDPVTGMILNLADVKRLVNEVLERYDHRNLNVDHPAFAETLPTTEQIAMQLAREIGERVDDPARLDRIRLWETEDLFAEVLLP